MNDKTTVQQLIGQSIEDQVKQKPKNLYFTNRYIDENGYLKDDVPKELANSDDFITSLNKLKEIEEGIAKNGGISALFYNEVMDRMLYENSQIQDMISSYKNKSK